MNRKSLLAALALAVLAPAVQAALEAGAPAPDFKADASLAGKPFKFSLQDALKKGPVVVYFYPSAYTQGCNVQAHTFAENIDQFHAAGATVIGVSLDSIERLNEFSADPEYCAGKLPVASDAKGDIARSYGLKIIDSFAGKQAVTMMDSRGKQIGHEFTERVTFIVVPGGKISSTIGGMSPADNVKAALAAVQELKGHAAH
ncbi:MAG: peroxiredoxin [Steroidobacteraceae bacterium]